MSWLRWTLAGIAVVMALLLIAFGSAWWLMQRSLPVIDGEIPVAGLSAAATLERDSRGIPVISARSRADAAFATGYAHAQDRFFQMDLSRRLAAGELSELFGPVALKQDRRTRRFGFRVVAREVIDRASPAEREIIEAYSRGVNAGLTGLAAPPWEYLVLRSEPRAWAVEDSVLVVHAMWWQLQHGSLLAEIDRRRLERAAAARSTKEAAKELITFLYAGHTNWDTPNYSAEAKCVLVACSSAARALARLFPALLTGRRAPPAMPESPAPASEAMPGSNSWAVAGIHTKSGVAIIANDMHLDIGVPVTWYPARLRVQDEVPLDITGVTLPGTPAVAAGSNGRVAWGFTNSYGDFSDIRFGPCNSAEYATRRESIVVRDAATVEVEFHHAGAGVVLDGEEFAEDVARGECAQAAWLATRPEATNFALLGLERATTIDDVLTLAPSVGIPAQNLVVGDAGGRIAWTLLGRVPRGTGSDRLFGALEFRDTTDHPRLADPPVGRLWTANQRVIDGPLEAVIGDDEADIGAGGYDIGARARQIRDRLLGLNHPATEADMLAIQLDARAVFLARWRNLLLELIDEDAMSDAPKRREFRDLVSHWKPEAAPDSVGYLLVRQFRGNALDALWRGLSAGVAGQSFEGRRPGQFELAGWRLLSERPASVAPPGAANWRAYLMARVDDTIAVLEDKCGALGDCTFGASEPVAIRHPLSRAMPLLSGLLDMPTRQLPGDHHMPRVQDGSFGASERFAVAPGREAEGYLQLPGGPSGHPLSPFYRSGFDDWAEGRPTPFLPGPPAHSLRLRPSEVLH